MHVLAMCHAYPPDHNAGAEMTLHALLYRMVQDGHQVDVLLSRPGTKKGRYDYDGVFVNPYTNSGDPLRWFAGTEPRPDVVIAHLENTQRAAALSDAYDVPMVHLIHNTHEFTKGALRRGPVQLAVFNSDWMRQDYADMWAMWTKRPLPPHIVVHPPVWPEDYATTHGQRITLINLNEDKGGELFWRLAEALPDRQFLGVLGAYGPQVVEHADNVLLQDHVSPKKMIDVYGQTKILLMPSNYESYGRTAIEAAASGIPTIAHPTPGLKEALGKAGTFVDRDDIDGWVEAIKYLSSPRGFSYCSKAARALSEERNPQDDLDRFADAMQGVVRRGVAAYAR